MIPTRLLDRPQNEKPSASSLLAVDRTPGEGARFLCRRSGLDWLVMLSRSPRALTVCAVLGLFACESSSTPPPGDSGLDLARDQAITSPEAGRDAGPPREAAAPDQRLDGPATTDRGPDAASWPTGFTPVTPNVPTGYLCNVPADYVANGGDPVHPPCDLEAELLSDRDPAAPKPAQIKVVTWNIEFGKKSAEIKQALLNDKDLVGADVLLLQEVPRHDLESAPPSIDLGRELAQLLKMNFVFSVEWDRRLVADQGGEHGTAILTKFPIGNVTQIRHTALFDFYALRKNFGGRNTVGADLVIGNERYRFYSSHFCTNDVTGSGRAKQGAEVRADAALVGRPAVQLVGGDLNTFLCNPLIAVCNQPPSAEKVVLDFLDGGWTDLLPGFNSWTELGRGVFPQRLDWIFGKGLTHHSHVVLQSVKPSDHVPVVTVVALP